MSYSESLCGRGVGKATFFRKGFPHKPLSVGACRLLDMFKQYFYLGAQSGVHLSPIAANYGPTPTDFVTADYSDTIYSV